MFTPCRQVMLTVRVCGIEISSATQSVWTFFSDSEVSEVSVKVPNRWQLALFSSLLEGATREASPATPSPTGPRRKRAAGLPHTPTRPQPSGSRGCRPGRAAGARLPSRGHACLSGAASAARPQHRRLLQSPASSWSGFSFSHLGYLGMRMGKLTREHCTPPSLP